MDDSAAIKDLGVSTADMKNFCAAIGQLMVLASLIDAQLNKAVFCMTLMPEHALILPIIAQLDPRIKVELIKKQLKLVDRTDFTRRVLLWVKHVETVNSKRNMVAHHGMRIKDGAIGLYSDQLSKIMDRLESDGASLQASPAKNLDDIAAWIEQAVSAHVEGTSVLDALERNRKMKLEMLDPNFIGGSGCLSDNAHDRTLSKHGGLSGDEVASVD